MLTRYSVAGLTPVGRIATVFANFIIALPLMLVLGEDDTRTPLVFAIVRVAMTTVVGYVFSIHLPRWLGVDQRLGVAGLMVSSSLAGWVEYVLLRRSLNKRIGRTGLTFSYLAKLFGAALAGVAVGWGLKMLVMRWHPIPLAVVVLGGYGMTYFAVGHLLGLTQAKDIFSRGFRILRK